MTNGLCRYQAGQKTQGEENCFFALSPSGVDFWDSQKAVLDKWTKQMERECLREETRVVFDPVARSRVEQQYRVASTMCVQLLLPLPRIKNVWDIMHTASMWMSCPVVFNCCVNTGQETVNCVWGKKHSMPSFWNFHEPLSKRGWKR